MLLCNIFFNLYTSNSFYCTHTFSSALVHGVTLLNTMWSMCGSASMHILRVASVNRLAVTADLPLHLPLREHFEGANQLWYFAHDAQIDQFILGSRGLAEPDLFRYCASAQYWKKGSGPVRLQRCNRAGILGKTYSPPNNDRHEKPLHNTSDGAIHYRTVPMPARGVHGLTGDRNLQQCHS